MPNRSLLFGGLCQVTGFLCTGAASILKDLPVFNPSVNAFVEGFLFGLATVAYLSALILFGTMLAKQSAGKMGA